MAYGDGGLPSPGGQQGGLKEINPKRIYGKAQPQNTQCIWFGLCGLPLDGMCWLTSWCFNRQLVTKFPDEMKALQLGQNKVRQKKVPMEVIGAEY